MAKLTPCLETALDRVSTFIAQTTGRAATQEEIADALMRYFVLEEIRAHIKMQREASANTDD